MELTYLHSDRNAGLWNGVRGLIVSEAIKHGLSINLWAGFYSPSTSRSLGGFAWIKNGRCWWRVQEIRDKENTRTPTKPSPFGFIETCASGSLQSISMCGAMSTHSCPVALCRYWHQSSPRVGTKIPSIFFFPLRIQKTAGNFWNSSWSPICCFACPRCFGVNTLKQRIVLGARSVSQCWRKFWRHKINENAQDCIMIHLYFWWRPTLWSCLNRLDIFCSHHEDDLVKFHSAFLNHIFFVSYQDVHERRIISASIRRHAEKKYSWTKIDSWFWGRRGLPRKRTQCILRTYKDRTTPKQLLFSWIFGIFFSNQLFARSIDVNLPCIN